MFKFTLPLTLFVAFNMLPCHIWAQDAEGVDKVAMTFLENEKNKWDDWNVPYQDGKVLYDIIVKNNYKTILEVGTSTGHSTIWLAMAARKTGGKVITLEIDEGRRAQALQNFEQAGVSEYIDARLVDAHKEVKALKAPIDFVFLDADKGWYTQYFLDLENKVPEGGCITAHNVLNGYRGLKDYMDYVESRKDFITTIDRSSSSGISISYKKK